MAGLQRLPLFRAVCSTIRTARMDVVRGCSLMGADHTLRVKRRIEEKRAAAHLGGGRAAVVRLKGRSIGEGCGVAERRTVSLSRHRDQVEIFSDECVNAQI